jgi:hypothetical protein
MESYLATSWIDPATATAHQKLMENVTTMENAGKCVSYTKQPARYAISPMLLRWHRPCEVFRGLDVSGSVR